MTDFRKLLFFVLLAMVAVGVYYRLRIGSIPGVRVTSWWRTPWHNAKVGGVEFSKHQIGLAFDVTPVTEKIASDIRKLGVRKVINECNHLHVEVI